MQCIPLLTRTPSETRRVREICTNESLARKRNLHRKGRPTKLKEILQYVYRAGQHTYQIYPKQRKTLYSRENHLDNHQDNLLHQKKMPVHLERGRFCDKVAYLFKKEKKLLLIKKNTIFTYNYLQLPPPAYIVHMPPAYGSISWLVST